MSNCPSDPVNIYDDAVIRDPWPHYTRLRAKGPVVFSLMHGELPGEVEMDLGIQCPVNPQIKGALQSLEGVMAVEEC